MSRGESEDDDTDDDDADESVHCWCGRDCDFSKVDIVDVERGGTTWGRGEVGARHTRVSVDTFLFCSFFSFIRLVCAFSPKSLTPTNARLVCFVLDTERTPARTLVSRAFLSSITTRLPFQMKKRY